jgi:hypothetical protein
MSKVLPGLLLIVVLAGTGSPALAQESTPTPVGDATADPNGTRLFYGPTARSLPAGKVYLGAYGGLLPFLQVGVTNRLSIGGGTPILFGMEDFDRPFWITPKLQVLDTGRTQVALGAFHAFDTDGNAGGVAYGVVTTGHQDASFTAGAGMTYAVDGGRIGVVMVGGDKRIGRHVKLITENYIWQGGSGVVTGGFRFFGEHLSADLGMTMPFGTGHTYLFPVVNFAYAF